MIGIDNDIGAVFRAALRKTLVRKQKKTHTELSTDVAEALAEQQQAFTTHAVTRLESKVFLMMVLV